MHQPVPIFAAVAALVVSLLGQPAAAQQPTTPSTGSCSGALLKCLSGCPEGAKGNRCPIMCQQTKDSCMQTGDWISPFSNSTVVVHNLRRE
jgi:hypothetical protein